MLTETMMCIPLYDDMASVFFDSYENKDERSPYALFIVGIEADGIYVFSSEECIGPVKATPYKDWIKEHSNENSHEPQRRGLRHKLYITSYQSPGAGQSYDEAFFSSLFKITDMVLQTNSPVYKNCVHIVVYKDSELKRDLVPLMESIYEAALILWREYFTEKSSKDILHPIIEINKMIESLGDFEEIVPFFETVTKISSLFYEKSRSKGSIAIMNSRKDDHLISFKADTQAEMLSFSVEYAQQLRKLLETAKDGLSLLVYDNIVYGIGRPDPFRTQYTFNLTGHMEWHVSGRRKDNESIRSLCYKHGKYYLPSDDEIQNWYIDSKINDPAVRKLVNFLLSGERIKEFDHGAILIISNNVENEMERLCRLERGLRIEQVSMTAHFKDTCTLCAIDGSLFLDKDGFCHGIGIILDGEAITKGTLSRGSRYNSAKTYISRCVVEGYEAYALVVSSDGYLDILTTYDEEFDDIRNIQKTEEKCCQ